MADPPLLRPRASAAICYTCFCRVLSVQRRRLTTFKQQKIDAVLPKTPARTRFAPSPTGYLHLGSLRTALFNYLLAKSTGGQFLLRIEDTDQKRTVPDAEKKLFKDLRWAGLQWDEGPEVGGPHGPYKQSQRSVIYQEHAQKLLDSGHAYRCFCSAERLNALAQHRHQLGLATDYDRTCASIPQEESQHRASKGESYTIRLLVPAQYPVYKDLIHGTFRPLQRRGHVIEASFEDPILLKSDGFPTYHLANVVDDHLMKITHVIRGSEWMPSTPKHVALYSAFNWTPPSFAHVGLLADEYGNKLSKRNFDTDITAFREMEIFPETLTNFAALLGWSHTRKSDVMNLQELMDNFSLKFTKGNTTVTFGKMHFLQRKHALVRVQEGGVKMNEMIENVARILTSSPPVYPDWRMYTKQHSLEDYISRIIRADAENYTNAHEFLYRNSFFFSKPRKPNHFDAGATPEDVPRRAKMLADVREQEWDKEHLTKKMHEVIDGRLEGKKGGIDVYHYMRRTLTGEESGMRIYDILMILGREEVLTRLGCGAAEKGGEKEM